MPSSAVDGRSDIRYLLPMPEHGEGRTCPEQPTTFPRQSVILNARHVKGPRIFAVAFNSRASAMRRHRFRPVACRSSGRTIVLMDGATEREFVEIIMPSRGAALFAALAIRIALASARRVTSRKDT